MSFAEWLIVNPTLEQELQLETDARAILEDDNHKDIAQLCSILTKQNWYQKQIIKQAITRITELEVEIETMKDVDAPKKRPWWSALLN